MLDRRACLLSFGLLPLGVLADWQLPGQRRLILIELQGGNDGLNTVVPFNDPVYTSSRPTLALGRDQCVHLIDGLGLHPAMHPLLPIWQNGELAIAQGLGYDNPNRSHFRSTDIWMSASDSLELKRSGWLADALAGRVDPLEIAAVVFGGRDDAFRHGGLNTVSLRRLDDLNVPLSPRIGNTETLAAQLVEKVRLATSRFQRQVMTAEVKGLEGYPSDRLGRQASEAMGLIAAGVSPPIVQLHHKGFDTHSNQQDRQHRLLSSLSRSLAAMRRDLIRLGQWNNTLIITVSEFGRRVAENGSGGTDHGTAAPQFALGGQVKGGLYGQAPSLLALQEDDLVHTVDFRSLYATVLHDWLRLSDSRVNGRVFDRLPIFRRG